jgi:hypothetical protein
MLVPLLTTELRVMFLGRLHPIGVSVDMDA